MVIIKKIATVIKIIVFSFSNPLLAIIQQALIKLKIITYPPEFFWHILLLIMPLYLYFVYQKTGDKFRGNLFGFLNSAVSNITFFCQIILAGTLLCATYLLIFTDILPKTTFFAVTLIFINILLIVLPAYLLFTDYRKTVSK